MRPPQEQQKLEWNRTYICSVALNNNALDIAQQQPNGLQPVVGTCARTYIHMWRYLHTFRQRGHLESDKQAENSSLENKLRTHADNHLTEIFVDIFLIRSLF
jgi:hypothetical protein